MTVVVRSRSLRCEKRRHRSSASFDDRGDTLIEVLITLIVLSVSGLALLTAFTATITGSAQHRSLAANDVVLRTVAESAFSAIQQQQSPEYQPCATTATYSSANNYGAPSSYTVTIESVQYPVSGGGWTAAIPSDCATIASPQLITVQVRASNGTTDQTSFVVDGRQQVVATSGSLGIRSLTPSSLGQGALVQNLVLDGFGFVSGATVSFTDGSGGSGGVVVNSTQFTSSTSLAVNVTVPSDAVPGDYDVTVTDPGSGGATVSHPNLFFVNAAPSVSSSTPTSLPQGVQDQTVTIDGSGFINGALASFLNSGVTVVPGSTVYDGPNELTMSVSVTPTASTTGSGAVTVTNPDGSNGSGGNFTVTSGMTITSISSSSSSSQCEVSYNQSGTCVITGTGFDSGTTVVISANATSIEPVTVTSTSITFSVTGEGTTSGGTGNITVTNANGVLRTVADGFVNG